MIILCPTHANMRHEYFALRQSLVLTALIRHHASSSRTKPPECCIPEPDTAARSSLAPVRSHRTPRVAACSASLKCSLLTTFPVACGRPEKASPERPAELSGCKLWHDRRQLRCDIAELCAGVAPAQGVWYNVTDLTGRMTYSSRGCRAALHAGAAAQQRSSTSRATSCTQQSAARPATTCRKVPARACGLPCRSLEYFFELTGICSSGQQASACGTCNGLRSAGDCASLPCSSAEQPCSAHASMA